MKTKIFLVFSNITLLTLLLVSWNSKENTKPSFTNRNNFRLNLITEEDAKLLTRTYNTSVNNINNSNRRLFSSNELSMWDKDSRCVWFSYNELQNYLNFIKTEFDNFNDPNKGNLGIRIYFGRYPENLGESASPGLRTQRDLYKNKHCLFFVPTINREGSKLNYDYIFNVDSPKKGFQITNIYTIGSEKNHGNLVPPESYKGSFFYDINGNPQ